MDKNFFLSNILKKSIALLRVEEMRRAEGLALAEGTSSERLMSAAGEAVFREILSRWSLRQVTVLCGPGNNGGDGFVVAQLLAAAGWPVRLGLWGDRAQLTAEAACQAQLWTGPIEPLLPQLVTGAELIVDAVFGTRLSRPLDAALKEALTRLRQSARMVIAADVPSGVETDSGTDLGAMAADVTVALAAFKPAHLLQPSASRCGHILVADIGIDATSARQVIARPKLAPPTAADHKYTRGLVTVLSGEMNGAARLVATAAARSGAGYVVLAGDTDAADTPLSIVHRSVETALSDARMSALVLGPGLGRSGDAEAMLHRLLLSNVSLVLDADALRMAQPSQIKRRQSPTILTPHGGEFEALFGPLSGSKIDQALTAAEASGATVLFKGADTVIASPDGRVGIAGHSSPWLSTAGTGDVIAGIAAAMLGRGIDAHDAACAAVWLHNRAAHLAGPALIADDLCTHLPEALAATL